ncbi:MAG: FAD-linked oxidase C-terminal domain-containing protein [Methylocella sp.]
MAEHRGILAGGACTGERGNDPIAIAFIEDELGAAAVDLMRRVKAAFDPQNLFNLGNVFAV